MSRAHPAAATTGATINQHAVAVDGAVPQQAGRPPFSPVNVGAGQAAQVADAGEGRLPDDHNQADAHANADANLHTLQAGQMRWWRCSLERWLNVAFQAEEERRVRSCS